jgi:serine/threonine protein kinase
VQRHLTARWSSVDPALDHTHANPVADPGPPALTVGRHVPGRGNDETLAYTSVEGELRPGDIRADLSVAASGAEEDRYDEGPLLGRGGMGEVLDWGLAKLSSEPAGPGSGEREPAHGGGHGADGAHGADGPDGGDGTDSMERLVAQGAQVTRVGDVLGTPMYMAPEQFGATSALGPQADVFGLGIILFEILTLKPYRQADSIGALLVEATTGGVRLPSGRAPDVPPELDDACGRALSRDPAARGTARLLAMDLESHLEGDREKGAREALSRGLLASASQHLISGRGRRGRAGRGDARRGAGARARAR